MPPSPRRRALTGGLVVLLAFAAVAPAAAAAAAPHRPDPTLPRNAVPAAYQWKPEHVFPDLAAWESEFAAVEADLPRLGEYAGRLAESPAVLHACLEDVYGTLGRLYHLYVFADSRYNVDQAVAEEKTRKGRIEMMLPRFGQTVAFLDPEILSIDQATLDGFLAASDDLRRYAHHLRNVRRLKDHTLSPGEERILALTGNVVGTGGEVHEALLNVDLEFPPIVDERGESVPLTLTSFSRYRSSSVYNVRKQAAEAFFGILRKHENTLAASLDGAAKAHVMTMQARGYGSCLEAALAPDDISPAAYRMLLETIGANLERTLHKYVALRRKVLGLQDPLTFANLYNPLLPRVEQTHTYDASRQTILAGLAPLGKEYLTLLAEGMDPANGWVDVYPNANKRGGAYSQGLAYDAHPFVLLNHDDTLDALFTVAHEYGHALHSHYSNRHQPPVYANYTTFLAEVASTCNEALLLDHLLRQAKSPELRLALLNHRLESIRLTIFRQTLFAEFELRFHEEAEKGRPLTAEFLHDLYGGLVRKYYGPQYALGENDEVEWAFIPHFYYNFYVFSYATGLTSGLSIAQQIQRQGASVAQRYIDGLLKAGASAPPLEILKRAGVDLETPRPILDMLDLFERTVDEFDALWAKQQAGGGKARG